MRVSPTLNSSILTAAVGMLQPFCPELTPRKLIAALKKYETNTLEQNLRINDAAELFGVSRKTIYEWVRRGHLVRAGHAGCGIRITRQSVIDFSNALKG